MTKGTEEVVAIICFLSYTCCVLKFIQPNKSVAVESTDVYWIHVYDILAQAGFEVVLVNAYCL